MLMDVKIKEMDTSMKILKEVHVDVKQRLKGYVESGFEWVSGVRLG